MKSTIKEEIEVIVSFFVFVFLVPLLGPLGKIKNYIDKKVKEIEEEIKLHESNF